MTTPDLGIGVRTVPSNAQRSWLGSSMRRQEAVAGYIAILPWLLGFVLFALGPILASFVLMFMKWEIITPATWVGWGNFRRLLTDPLVLKSLYNTLFYTALSVPLHLIAALIAAYLLNVGVKSNNVYRSLIYLPSQMPVVASSILWFFIFSPTYGLANAVLGWFGVEPQQWLWDVNLVKPSLIIMAVWSLGNAMIIFLAGMQAIPATLYEAARIDGANGWHEFRHIMLPMLSPTIFFNFIIGVIGSFQVFSNVFIMTNGGPGDASLMLVLYIYQNAFQNFKMGYASVLAWLLLCIVLIITMIQFRASRSWVYYEGEVR